MRRAAIGLALLALSVSPGVAHTAEPGPLVVLKAPDRHAAAAVPVIGGRVQRAVTRGWLTQFGEGLLIRRVRFFWKARIGPAARVDVAPPPNAAGVFAGQDAAWQADLFQDEVARALRRRGKWLEWVDTYVGGKLAGGGRVVAAGVPLRAPAPAALAADADRRARASGLDVTGSVRPLRPAALQLEVRLRESDLFATADGWTLGRLLPPRHGGLRPLYDLRLVVLAPTGGVLLTTAGAGTGGSAGAGPLSDEPVPIDPPPPELLIGATQLAITFTTYDTRYQPSQTAYTLTCGAAPSGVADAAAVCDRVLRDRWALFGPESDICIGGLSGPQVSITGTVADHPVRRGWGNCGDASVLRWAATLGVTLG